MEKDNVILKVSDLKKGEWFFDLDGELYMLKDIDKTAGITSYIVSNGYVEAWLNPDHIAIKLTIISKTDADYIRKCRNILMKDGMLTQKTSKQMNDFALRLYRMQMENITNYTNLYNEIDEWVNELKAHMSYFK